MGNIDFWVEVVVSLLTLGGIGWKSFDFGWNSLDILILGGISRTFRLWVELVGNMDFGWNRLGILMLGGIGCKY